MNVYTLSFSLILIFNILKCKKSLHALQSNLYNEDNKYIKWIIKNIKQVFITLEILSIITIVIAYVLNNNLSSILVVLSIGFYVLESMRIINNARAENKNKSLIMTKRIKRIAFTTTILMTLPILVYLINRDNVILMLVIESIMTYLNYLMVLISKIINIPIEKIVNKFNKTKAKEKLKEMNNLEVIGITGSYGKTSTKFILNDILSNKFITKSSPKNVNTEHGLVMTINSYIDRYDQVFIAEMGAYRQGEIKKKCDLVHPKYAILTNIGLAHLNTFGTPEVISKTMFELIDALPKDGVAILNKDDYRQVTYDIKSKCKQIWISIDNEDADIRALNIVSNHKGSKFDVVFKEKNEKYSFETKLLGNYNIYNILASIALGIEFGMSIKELVQAVKKLKAPKARLELIDLGYMYKIDDSYNNSNPLGIKLALDVLETMPGIKVVVTSGIKDQDGKEKQLNHIFGTQISKVADTIILVGAKKTRKIFDGILENGYDKDRLFVVNNISDAYNLLKSFKTTEKIYALFEQDLPDTYIE